MQTGVFFSRLKRGLEKVFKVTSLLHVKIQNTIQDSQQSQDQLPAVQGA